MPPSPESFLPVGKLMDVQWQVGVAAISSTCHNLSSPFILIALKISDSNGIVTTKSMEMSVGEFYKFHVQLKEMASALSAV